MFTVALLLVCLTLIVGQNAKLASDPDHLKTSDTDQMKTVKDYAGLTPQDQQLLIGNINRDIENLDSLIKKKDDLEHHIVVHFDLVDVDADDINLNQARSALQTIDAKKLKLYKESLQASKTKLIRSNGKAQLDVVKEIGYLRENVNTLMEAFQENMKIAETKDHEFEEFDEISSEVEELLIEYIDKDIKDLDEVIKHKNDLQHHIVEHFELEDVDPDDLKLKVAESAIHSVDVDKLKHYEESLQDLKTKLTKSSGKVKSAVVSQIANTRENAKTLFEAFQENIKIAESFDHEFEEHEESMKNLARSKLNSAPPTGKFDDVKLAIDISYPEKVEDAGHVDVESIETKHYENLWANQEPRGNFKPVEQVRPTESIESRQYENFWAKQEAHGNYKPVDQVRPTESIESRLYENFWANQEAHENYKPDEGENSNMESKQWISSTFIPSPFFAIFSMLTLVLMVVLAMAANKRYYKSDKGKFRRVPGASKGTSSPELEVVKEDEGWTSKSWSAKSNRRRKLY